MKNVEQIEYTGPLWHIWERVPHPSLASLLTSKDQLIVLKHGSPPYKVVFGVPHQTGSGDWHICERRLDKNGQVDSRVGDDNVASIALVAFSRLTARQFPCKLVIMAHPTTHDPNKRLDSPYCREIFREPTSLLWECHACRSSRHLDLELSAGRNRVTPTISFGWALAKVLGYRYLMGVQAVAGDRQAIIFHANGTTSEGILQLPATRTASLTEAGERGIPALHLETKPFFREAKDEINTVTLPGLVLGWAIAETVMHLAR